MEAKPTHGTISLILTTGSKISLISKSERRYEGIFYSLDLEEATISLQKVRSFGTEDRPTPRLVPPKSKVYEFTNFRVADIKDIEVLKLPTPFDKEEQQQPNEEPIDSNESYRVLFHQQPPPPIGSSLEAVGGVTADHNNMHRNSYPYRCVGLVGGPMLGVKFLPQSAQQQPHHPQQFSLGVGFGSSSSNARPTGPPTVPPLQSSGSSSTATQRQQRPPSPSSPDRNRAQQNRQQQPCAHAPRGRGVQHPSPQQQQPQQFRLCSANPTPRGDQDQRNGGYNNFGRSSRQPQNAQGNDESDDDEEFFRKVGMFMDAAEKFADGVSNEIPPNPFSP